MDISMIQLEQCEIIKVQVWTEPFHDGKRGEYDDGKAYVQLDILQKF